MSSLSLGRVTERDLVKISKKYFWWTLCSRDFSPVCPYRYA